MVFVSVSTNTAYIGNARTVVRASTFRVSVLPGCNVALPGCTGVLPGCTGVLPGCTGVLPGCNVALPGCNVALPGCIGVLPGCIVQGHIESYRVNAQF